MDEPNHLDEPDTADLPKPPRGGRRGVVGAIAAVTAILGFVVTLVVAGVGDDDDTRTAAPPDSTAEESPDTTEPTDTTAATTTGVETTTTAPPGPSAADGLAPFLTATADLDARLHEAATAINGAGPPWEVVTSSVAEKVSAADFVPVGRTIPAGLPPDLRHATVLVYSDLVSRAAAMKSFAFAGEVGRTEESLLDELGKGHAAAERFDSDLAALRSLAAASPPLEAPPVGDRAYAEVLLLVRFTDMANRGCDSSGGWVATEMPEIVWSEGAPPEWIQPGWQHYGTIGVLYPIDFTANLMENGSWDVQIWAC